MPKEKLGQILGELRGGLEAIYGQRLSKVVLFGSQARGDFRPEPQSDIDVLVVLEGPVDLSAERGRASHIAAELSLRHDVTLSCLYVSEESYRQEQSPLLINVRREGIAV